MSIRGFYKLLTQSNIRFFHSSKCFGRAFGIFSTEMYGANRTGQSKRNLLLWFGCGGCVWPPLRVFFTGRAVFLFLVCGLERSFFFLFFLWAPGHVAENNSNEVRMENAPFPLSARRHFHTGGEADSPAIEGCQPAIRPHDSQAHGVKVGLCPRCGHLGSMIRKQLASVLPLLKQMALSAIGTRISESF